MDMISYGIAGKADKKENETRSSVLGVGVEGAFRNTKERMDSLSQSIAKATSAADKLILQNSINLMKAQSKLNVVATSKKYRLEQMLFDDLLDNSGIVSGRTSGVNHNQSMGVVTYGAAGKATFSIDVGTGSTKGVLSVESSVAPNVSVSWDDGGSWESVGVNELFHFKLITNVILIRVELPQNEELYNYALSWA